MPIGNRALIRVAAAGVVLSAVSTAATFSGNAAQYTFLRYPILGAAIALVAISAWGLPPLPRFNRTLWDHAPWWARLTWIAVLIASLALFATISLSEPGVTARAVLEARGIGAVAAYLFLIAGLLRNVAESQATGQKASG